MKILDIDKKPFHTVHYMAVQPGNIITEAQLPFLNACVDSLPGGLGALVACADLQGRIRAAEASASGGLLGIQVAEVLEMLCERGKMPKAEKVGILLAGDLFAREGLDRRGGRGDVREVWDSCGAPTGSAGSGAAMRAGSFGLFPFESKNERLFENIIKAETGLD
jgi:hypothetical protein